MSVRRTIGVVPDRTDAPDPRDVSEPPDPLDRIVGRIPREVRIVFAILFAAFAFYHHATATLNRDEGPGRGDVSLADVRDAGIFPTRAWLDGVNPYDWDAFRAYDDRIGQPFPVYSPVHIVTHLPFAVGPVEGSRVAFYWLSLWLVAGLSALTLRAAGRRATFESGAMLFGAILWSHPGALSLVAGQSGPMLTIGAVLALTASSPAMAVLGAVLVLTKPTFGLPVIAMMWARGRGRSAIMGVAVTAAVSVVVFARLAASNSMQSIIDGFQNNLDVTAAIGSPKRIELFNSIARLTGTSPPLVAELVFGVAVLATATLIVRRLWRSDPMSDLGLAIAWCTPTLVFFHGSWDLITVIPAFVLLLRRDPGSVLTDPVRWTAVGLLAYALWNPWGRRFSEGLYNDWFATLMAAGVRTASVTAAWALLMVVAQFGTRRRAVGLR